MENQHEHSDLHAQLAAEREAREKAERERDALQAFKDFVHQYLDEAGVPTHPEGEHSKAGCRIGDRLDILVRERDEARVELARVRTIAVHLWQLLDDIDTQDDASKSNDKHFRDCAYRIQRRRFDVLSDEEWDKWRAALKEG